MSIFYKQPIKLIRNATLMSAGICTCPVAFGNNPTGSIQIVFENRVSADSIIALYQGMDFKRVIPFATNPEIEARHRDSGMDLWYLVKTSSKANTRTAAHLEPKDFEKCKGVRGVFETQLIEMPESPSTADADFTRQEPRCSTATRSGITMNDPLYPRQWHYDMINMEKAWELEQGKRNVIVAVMDGWIDHTHPDIAANMWVNEAELNGEPGVDDDGNGYVDDIYGYNASNDPDYFSPHGTHVAGTIAAVNNNGIGVCGVAGGNGIDSGVRVMSIGVINDGQKIPDWVTARGYVYAADNGAVISQNSWEGSEVHQSQVLNEAISYFMENAGKQRGSPMRGGLVIFAAGNDNSNTPHYPLNGRSLNRDRFITVGAISAEKIRTSYSNYGWWVDVAAPGGEQDGNSIMSTTTGNGYMFMNGTSMACPHVSGVAALIVSKFGSADLTPEFVKNRILFTATPIEGNQAGYNHEKESALGIVNAYAALCDKNKTAPATPEDFTVKAYYKSYGLYSWKIPADSNGNAPTICRIYAENGDVPYVIVKTSGAEVGSRFEYLDKSEHAMKCTEYTIEAVDCDGNISERSSVSTIEDCTKDLAIVNPYRINDFVVYKPSEPNFTESLGEVTLHFFVNCDGPKTVEIESPADFIKCDNHSLNDCEVTFDVSETTLTGTYPFTIKVIKKDEPDKFVQLPLTCTVKKALCSNRGVASITGEQTLKVVETTQRKGSISIDLSEYLYHPWGTLFDIRDDSGTKADDFFGYDVKYTIADGVLNAEYDFSNAFIPCSVNISFDTIDEYMKTSLFYVEIKFIGDQSGIEDVISDKNVRKSGIYTIYGVKLDCEVENLPSGIYIINGKKVLIHKK